MEHSKHPVRRCAVYTRKSSEERLEQDFNSLDAQREACEAFIQAASPFAQNAPEPTGLGRAAQSRPGWWSGLDLNFRDPSNRP